MYYNLVVKYYVITIIKSLYEKPQEGRRNIGEKKEINFLHFFSSFSWFWSSLKIRLTHEVFKKGIKKMKGPVRQESATELRSKGERCLYIKKTYVTLQAKFLLAVMR